jgi:hypothetical protein
MMFRAAVRQGFTSYQIEFLANACEGSFPLARAGRNAIGGTIDPGLARITPHN